MKGLFVLLLAVFALTLGCSKEEANKAKTAEAIDQLDKIYKGSSHYYSVPRVDRNTGTKLMCQFPASHDWTPSGSPCDHPDKKYPSNPSIWEAPTWSSLLYQMSDSHYFRYKYESSGEGANARFTATAAADLDCDGTWSTFQRFGYADENSTLFDCAMKGTSPFYKDNELE